jgi:threonine/homoserine/homoserine lactone efflux protein
VHIQNLPAFITASVIIMFIPGVDMALVTRQVVVHGRRAAFATLAGLLAGGLMHAAFAAIGLSAVLLTSAAAYSVVKTAGALYLIGLGLQTIYASRRRRGVSAARDEEFDGVPHEHGTSLRRSFVLGFVSDATNPKVAIFFLTFLPQFVVPGQDATAEIAFLGVLFNAIATSWWIGYVVILDHLAGWLRRSSVRTLIENVTGTVLVALGLRLAVGRR